MNLSKPVKMLYQFRIYSYILLSVFFLSCGLGSEKKKEYRNVSLLIDYSEENSRSFSKINEDGYVIAKCCEMFFVEMNEQSASNA